MLQVVFGDSEKATVTLALNAPRPSADVACSAGLIISRDSEMTQREKDAILATVQREFEQERARAKPLGGKREDVIGLPGGMDMGDIRGSVLSDARKELCRQIFSADPWNEESEIPDTSEKYWAGCVKDHRHLLQRASAGEPVRIWCSGTPHSVCGFYSVLHLLRDTDCIITAVRMPEYCELPDGTVFSARSFAELPPGDLAGFLPLESKVPDALRFGYAAYWEQLQRENAPLRAVINGKLHSVGADFYDPFLFREITEEPQTVSNVIGSVLGKYSLLISDWYLSCRMRHLIGTGEVSMVQREKGFYQCRIQKA